MSAFTRTVNIVVSLDGAAMADGAASVGFSGRQRFKRVKTTIRDEVRCLITELQKDIKRDALKILSFKVNKK